jgi:uncharacterized membrane protein
MMRRQGVNLSFLKLIRSVRASYWFLPSVMMVLAIGLGALMVWLDAGPASSLLDDISWYQKSKPEGAREVLSTVAGSMITVAGVVFSITIVAISFAANQYGPRILTNFMGDRGNQVTLGTFVATFAYSVVVLRTIHAGDTEFVPQLAVLVAMILALCSIAVLIYFIHHVPESMHINTVTARIGEQLIKSIADRAPPPADHQSADEEERNRLFEQKAQALFAAPSGQIRSTRDGYLQFVDEKALVELGCKHDLAFRLERAVGEFVYSGEAVASVGGNEFSERICDEARRSWRVGRKRTPEQDLLFLVDELVEIAARALSTGVNDPHTANTCVDWLTAAAAQVAKGRQSSRVRCDPGGRVRVVLPIADLKRQMERSFGQLRTYLAGDINATTHALTALGSLAEIFQTDEQRRVLIEHIDGLAAVAQVRQCSPSLVRVVEAHAVARAAIIPSQ